MADTGNLNCGCTWVVGHSHSYNHKLKKNTITKIFCHKLPADGDTLCPKHRLFATHYGEQGQRDG